MTSAARRDTIVAASSPPGTGAVSLLRVSGRDAEGLVGSVLRGLSSPTVALDDRRPRVAHLVDPDDDRVIDEVLVTLFRAPRSYTGETVVELGLHGNPLIVAEALRVLTARGARTAEPGEFTRRAFLEGRLDLTRAEAVMEVISAESRDALEQAQRQLGGALTRSFEDLRATLADVLGLVEATLEFPEDLDENSERALEMAGRRLDDVEARTASLIGSFERGVRVREGISVALVGRPNVGKSSIFNMLCGSDRAIVTPVAGTTRDSLDARLHVAGRAVRLVDTAGVAESDDPIEREGVSRTRRIFDEVDRLLLVLDGSLPLSPEDRELIAELAPRRGLLLVNKVDLEAQLEARDLEDLLPDWRRLDLSARTGEGLELLEEALAAELDHYPSREPAPISSERQRAELLRLQQRSAAASEHLSEGGDELAAEELRAALAALGRLVGSPTTDEDVLDRIFAKFCIGK